MAVVEHRDHRLGSSKRALEASCGGATQVKANLGYPLRGSKSGAPAVFAIEFDQLKFFCDRRSFFAASRH